MSGGSDAASPAPARADDDGGRTVLWDRRVRRATIPLHGGWLRADIHGVEHIPARGGVVLAANRLSFLDAVVLAHVPSRPVVFPVARDYVAARAARRLLPTASLGRGAGRGLRDAEDRIRAGEIVGVFPEGSRSRDGRLLPGRHGAARLALRTGAPIVPVGIIGSDSGLEAGGSAPTGGPVTVRVGRPIAVRRWTEGRPPRAVNAELTEEVMSAIAVLSGRERAVGRRDGSALGAPAPV